MPIQTDLSVSPYFDDYSSQKDFYKILFRPGVAVQTRELNQLQTILQKQIERFGDNVFKRGTIIDGCDITFHSVFPFVKIRDNEADGAPVNVAQYVGYNVRNQANVEPLVASISTVVSGFESQNPNLNTLYIRYLNSGFANVSGTETEVSEFAANQQLTVYDPDNIIEKITSFNDSSGFSNTDNVVIVSAIAIQNSSGGTTFSPDFYVGDHIGNGTANLQIVEKDTISNSEAVILRVKPRAIDLKAANSELWSLTVNTNIQSTNATPSEVANVVALVGTGAAATLKTGALGEVDQIAVTQKGSGYYVLPTVSIASPGATTGQIAAANLVPQNFLTTITVANASVTPVGTGYGMTVGEGVIYQKGYFSRVNEHLVVVEKYANTPDLKAVGFDTTEEIINSNQDQSLLDNATGAPNATAPGANRLKLTPRLVVLTKAEADANSEFFSIAEFSEGNPYKQNRQTVYNILGNEMARRTFEESGNYVLDQFLLNTKSPNTLNDEQTQFRIQIDAGAAYVNGKRIETVTNYEVNVNKGINTEVTNNAIISLNYGNYIRVKELGGSFIFKTGDQVSLYPTASQYITSKSGTAITTSGLGTSLGTARIRSIVHESGIPGTAEAVYRLYLFDIRLATARNFSLVRSVFYDGVNKAVADTVLENGVAVLKDNNLSSLMYFAGKPAVKNANNISYVYRTFNNTHSIATNGVITITVTGGETFPYTGVLSSTQEKEIIIVPLANAQFTANISGSVSCNATSQQVNGTSTAFVSELQAGDFLRINSSTIVQVNNIVNNTVLFTKSTPSGAASGNAVIYLPQNVPVSLDRSTRTANVDITSNTMFINLGASINVATAVAVAYNVKSSNTQPVTKTVNRDRYIRLRLANNAASNTGPWVLGIPDVFRLKSVHKGPNATFSDTDTTNVTNVTEDFYIDHNQTEDYYGISYLYKKPNSATTVANTDFLLVKLDHFSDSSEGLKAPGDSGSYDINDSLTLTNSTTTVNTLEIPEVYGVKGDYYDLRDQFDFRPQSANTVAANTVAANAPINPTEPSAANRFSTNDKKFPAPDSTLTGTVEYYVGRTDRVVIDDNGVFNIITGTPNNYDPPMAPGNALTINVLNIPPYPSVPYQMSAQTVQFIDTKIANEKYTGQRLQNYRVTTPIDAAQRSRLQPRGYTMVDIGSLERRIADLEYYTTFTLVESLTQKRTIPSSSNNSIDRFKFGFFVDGFDTYNYSDIKNPGYRASVVDGRLAPLAEQINLETQPTEDEVTIPYIEANFISQTKATDGPVFIPPITENVPLPDTVTPPAPAANTFNGTITVVPSQPVVQPTTNTVTQITATVIQQQKTTARSDSFPYVFEEFFYTMSATTGPIEFYINSRDNNMAVEFFQSQNENGPWTSIRTSAAPNALPITTTDITTKALAPLNDFRKIEHPGSLVRKSYGPIGGFIEDQFKMLLTHNPDAGRYYKIRVYKGRNHGANGRSGTFGYKLFYPADSTVNRTTTVNGFAPTTNYNITFDGLFVPYVPIDLSTTIGIGGAAASVAFTQPFNYSAYGPAGNIALPVSNSPQQTTPIAAEKIMHFKAVGLKPNTVHTVSLENVNVGARIKQDGKLLGQTIKSDADGVVIFALYFGAEINATTAVEKAAADILLTAGNKTMEIESSDGLSSASYIITIPSYVKEEINTPPPPPPIAAAVTSAINIAGGGGGWSSIDITAAGLMNYV
jgi:hypothetical protein